MASLAQTAYEADDPNNTLLIPYSFGTQEAHNGDGSVQLTWNEQDGKTIDPYLTIESVEFPAQQAAAAPVRIQGGYTQ